MELSDYLRILKQRGWLIILLALLTAGSAFAFSRMQPVINTATTRYLVIGRPDFGQTQTIKELRRDYAIWLATSINARKVIAELNEDMNPYDLLANFKVESSTDSNVLMLEFDDENCDVARNIVRVWGDQLVQWRTDQNAGLQKEDRIDVDLLNDAPNCGPTSPNTKVNTIAGGVFGILLGTLLVLMLEWIASTRLRYQKDVERHLQMPVIGKIPKKKR